MAEVICPQCGTVAELDEGQHAFCANCDFPLFWASRNETRDEAIEVMTAGGGEIDDDAKVTDIICRNCAERNPGDRSFCLKCGFELTRPEEEFDPEAPPALLLGDPEPPRSSGFLRGLVAMLLLVALGGGGYFGWQYWETAHIPAISVATLDATGDTGYDTAIQIGEGEPFIAYRDAGAQALRVVRCKEANCAGSQNQRSRSSPRATPAMTSSSTSRRARPS